MTDEAFLAFITSKKRAGAIELFTRLDDEEIFKDWKKAWKIYKEYIKELEEDGKRSSN